MLVYDRAGVCACVCVRVRRCVYVFKRLCVCALFSVCACKCGSVGVPASCFYGCTCAYEGVECMCASAHVCVGVSLHVSVCVNISACGRVFESVKVCACMCMYACVYVYACWSFERQLPLFRADDLLYNSRTALLTTISLLVY